MKTLAVTFCFLCGLLGSYAHAAEITVKLNDQEQAALAQLLDLAVRQGGVKVAGATDYFVKKFSSPAPAAPAAPAAAKPEEKKPVEGVK